MSGRSRLALALASSSLLALLCARLLPASPLALPWFSELELLRPRSLTLLALLPLLFSLPASPLAPLPARRRVLASALRTGLLVALSLALARPTTRTAQAQRATVFVVDVSDSIDDGSLASASAYIERARALGGRHRIELVTFAREAQRVPLGSTPVHIARLADGGDTNVERALALARGLSTPEHAAQLVLFSDLRETAGALARALVGLQASDIPLYVAPDVARTRPEVGVRALHVPQKVRAGESFEVQAELFARTPTRVDVRLLRDGKADAPESTRELALDAGSTTLSFRTQAGSAGKLRYRLELTPRGPDRFAENNHFERSTRVLGAPRILYVERSREQAEPLATLLRSVGFEVEVRVAASAPERSEQLAEVAFYLLSDVAAAELGQARMRAIVSFVNEGGGFMMVGGEQAFGPGGYRGTPLEPILPVALDGSLRREEPSVALVLAIDKSGSMAGEKLERAKEAALATAEQLGADNYLGVIGFDAEPLRVVRLAVASQRSSMARSIASLTAGGGTALFPALDAAYADLAGVRARVKHVVVLTDGQSQEEALEELVRSMRADGITVSAVGVGDDVNRGLLSALARSGGGRAYFTRDPSRVPRLFTEEAELVARSPLSERALHAQQVAPSAFLRGITVADAPALHGMVTTRARPAPSELVLTSQHGEPLLARVRSGLGWSLAFTSDLKARWSADWYRWRQLPQLLAQLVREHMRREPDDALAIATRLEDGTLHARIDVLSPSEQFVNALSGVLHSSGPGGTQQVALSQVGPGRYEARLPLSALGSYLLEARLAGPDAEPRIARGDFAHAFPAEYAPGPEQEALAQLPPGATALPAPEQLWAPRASADGMQKERWQPLVWLALLTFLVELALRRLPARMLAKEQRKPTST